MPIAATYKGVGIHAGQSAKRVGLVRREIDKIAKISDLLELFEICGDCSWSPEARLFAGARVLPAFSLRQSGARRIPTSIGRTLKPARPALPRSDGQTLSDIAASSMRIPSVR
jgi:hypothetical protein